MDDFLLPLLTRKIGFANVAKNTKPLPAGTMRKKKYTYNSKTLQFKEVSVPVKTKILRAFGLFSTILVTSFVIYLLTFKYFPTPREGALLREIDQMEYKYYSLNEQVGVMSKVLENIQDRDASVHRLMFGMEPIDEAIWQGGTGGHDQHEDITKNLKTSALLVNSQNTVNMLERQLVLQSKSLDTVIVLAKDREKMFASIPSIKPVQEDKLQRKINLLSGFGMRIHPVHKVSKMHSGIDFTAPKGTAIQSTGDGKVVRVKRGRTGYGKSVLIDHGYGYKTLYAHMHTIDVEVGDVVVKGQKIGVVGNSGLSTAPHCHYEVRLHDRPVNPINYVLDGLSPEEYQELVQLASVSNQSFD